MDVFAGSSLGRLETRRGDSETSVGGSAPGAAESADRAYGLPYLRMIVDGPIDGVVRWTGSGSGRMRLELSVWTGRGWRIVDAAVAGSAEADGTVVLTGPVHADEVSEGRVELLVQAVPRETTIGTPAADAFADPSGYDLAVAHLTDTQYLTEGYPEVYRQMTGWIAANAARRKIAFAMHTGDLVQNWWDLDQKAENADREFLIASEAQAILEAAVPSSTLPGNHDSRTGTDFVLYNRWFGPRRYAADATYGGSIAPDDNSANFSRFEAAGAPFLVVNVPYGYGERELAWAADVAAGHPDRNIVIGSHEHLHPKEADLPARRVRSTRWPLVAEGLWERVIAPNPNVVLTLSGHYHGIGTIVTTHARTGRPTAELLANFQEYRTHDGRRATGFQRLLQFDLAGGTVAVDTHSATLDTHSSLPFDYEASMPDAPSAPGPLRHRYSAADDRFHLTGLSFQFAKSVRMLGVESARAIA